MNFLNDITKAIDEAETQDRALEYSDILYKLCEHIKEARYAIDNDGYELYLGVDNALEDLEGRLAELSKKAAAVADEITDSNESYFEMQRSIYFGGQL